MSVCVDGGHFNQFIFDRTLSVKITALKPGARGLSQGMISTWFLQDPSTLTLPSGSLLF